ncbi:MAG: radical SAM protein [Pirellulales bacterium]
MAAQLVQSARWIAKLHFSALLSAPYKADLAITYKCNNDCPHCYNEADRLTLEAMPAADWKRVIDRLHQVGVPHLIFTGGEATLYPDLPEVIAHANSLGPICGLNTNGRRLAQRGYAKTLADAGLNHIQVTLGSHREAIHDRMMNARSFQQTIDGIRAAKEAGLHTITNTTLMKMNAGEMVHTIDFLYSLGVRTFAVNGMIYSGGGFDTGQAIREEQMPALLIRIRDRAAELGMRFLWYTPTMYCRLSPVELEIGAKRCNAAEYSVCVEPNGDVLPCQSFYVAAGNILRDPWETIWHSQLFHSFRDRELDPKAAGLPEMCWECPDLQLCGGGCRIEREAEAGQRSSVSGCSSGGCSSKGGCSSGGCSSGGCKTIQLVSIAHDPANIGEPQTPADSSSQNSSEDSVVGLRSTSSSGFVAANLVQIARTKRRGSGQFADS